MSQDEVFEDTRKNQKDGLLDYVKDDVLCSSFSYDRFKKGMEKIIGFRMKNNLTLPSLVSKLFFNLREKNDEPLYTKKR